MATLPARAPVAYEPLIPYAEEFLDVEDVEGALASGLRGEALADHLSGVAGRRYLLARRDEPKRPDGIQRGDVVPIRPEIVLPRDPNMAAIRHWQLTRCCLFRDRDAFLDEVSDW